MVHLGVFLGVHYSLFSFAYVVLQLKAAKMHSQTLKRVNRAPPGGQNHV